MPAPCAIQTPPRSRMSASSATETPPGVGSSANRPVGRELVNPRLAIRHDHQPAARTRRSRAACESAARNRIGPTSSCIATIATTSVCSLPPQSGCSPATSSVRPSVIPDVVMSARHSESGLAACPARPRGRRCWCRRARARCARPTARARVRPTVASASTCIEAPTAAKNRTSTGMDAALRPTRAARRRPRLRTFCTTRPAATPASERLEVQAARRGPR